MASSLSPESLRSLAAAGDTATFAVELSRHYAFESTLYALLPTLQAAPALVAAVRPKLSAYDRSVLDLWLGREPLALPGAPHDFSAFCALVSERARRVNTAFPPTSDAGLVEGPDCYHDHSVRGRSGGDAARGWELTIEDDMVGPAEAIRVFEWVATFWCGSACRRVRHRTHGGSYQTWEEDVALPGAACAP